MKRRYQDMVSLQLGDDRIYLVRGEHEVPGVARLPESVA
jgi:hypothetical protein